MIASVLRISTVIASVMAASSLALAVTIAAAGTIERTSAGCRHCLHAANAFGARPAGSTWQPSRLQLAAVR